MEALFKTCFKCGENKQLVQFYVHLAMGDGYLGKCKDCAKKDVRENYKANRQHYVEYEKARWPNKKSSEQKRKRSERYREYKKKWRTENRYKLIAHSAVAKALLSGNLTRKPCEQCGAEQTQAHHPDYSKPLDVLWLCRDCHRIEHSRLRGIVV